MTADARALVDGGEFVSLEFLTWNEETPFACGGPNTVFGPNVLTGANAPARTLNQAAEQGIDAFISGEASEQTIHTAREMGMHFYAAGHHATERYGVKALGEWLATVHGLEVTFIDIDNPV